MSKIITVPFGWILGQLYDLVGNYGLAMILFAVIVQLVLLPITAKSKKSMMKMSRMQPRIQELQRKYANDQAKQQEEIRKLQQEEGGMGCGGCLWSLVPMLILIPLYSVIREPLVYLLGQSAEEAQLIIDTIKAADPSLFTGNSYYNQIAAAQAIPDYVAELQAAGITGDVLQGIDFSFFGLNLGLVPEWKIFGKDWIWNWAHIGLALFPIISGASQVLQSLISRKMNNSVITNDKGLEDKEAAAKSQAAQTTKMMMYMMPLMSVFIGFGVPAALSLYWLIGGIIRTVEDIFLTKHYRKIYDAEDAARLERALALEAEEAEKERIRAERRAANPEGITANTSKKKMQQKKQQEEQAAKAAAAKEYAAKKGIPVAEEPEKQTLSGIPDRPFCKGRAYQADRYSATEE